MRPAAKTGPSGNRRGACGRIHVSVALGRPRIAAASPPMTAAGSPSASHQATRSRSAGRNAASGSASAKDPPQGIPTLPDLLLSLRQGLCPTKLPCGGRHDDELADLLLHRSPADTSISASFTSFQRSRWASASSRVTDMGDPLPTAPVRRPFLAVRAAQRIEVPSLARAAQSASQV